MSLSWFGGTAEVADAVVRDKGGRRAACESVKKNKTPYNVKKIERETLGAAGGHQLYRKR